MYNYYQTAAKKYAADILGERYIKSQAIIDRLSFFIVTQQDVQDFVTMLMDAYEIGFMSATDQYRESIAKLGYQLEIVPGQKKE